MMEKLLLDFAMGLVTGGTVTGLFSLFGDDGVDYKQLVKDFSDAVEKIVWDEALDEYSNNMNTLVQEFKDEYPNIESDEKKVSYITDRLNKLREDIDFLTQDNMIEVGMFHAIMGVNLHIFMMIELCDYDKGSENYIETNTSYINDWLVPITKSLKDRGLPTTERDVKDINENLHVLNFNHVGFVKGGVIENGYVVPTQMVCDKPQDQESEKPCYLSGECSASAWVAYACGGDEKARDYSCKDFQPYWGAYYYDERVRVSKDGQLGSELTRLRHYFRCDKRVDDGPFGCIIPIYIQTAKDQKANAQESRLNRIDYLGKYYSKTVWITQTINGWFNITQNSSWPNSNIRKN